MSDLDLNAIREAAEGATQEWRISQHWDERGREAPNRISGIYEPIPGQKLGSRSCVMTANFKGAEIDDIWISINPQDRTYLEVTPPRAVLALLDRLQAAEAERDRLRDDCACLLNGQWSQIELDLASGRAAKIEVSLLTAERDRLRENESLLSDEIVALRDDADRLTAALDKAIEALAQHHARAATFDAASYVKSGLYRATEAALTNAKEAWGR